MKTIYERFQDYLFERFPNAGSDQLIVMEESGLYQQDFLAYEGLPANTEIEP